LLVGIGVTVVRAGLPEAAQAAVPLDNLRTLGLYLTSTEFYVVPLVVVGALLAVGMIGSIAIARDEKQE
jgi:NADH:ubiquinone oxidoreductase subunit 6 (subunit J)